MKEINKGTTDFDRLCHTLYEANGDGTDFLNRKCGVPCRRCGNELFSYYCEDRLYVISCPNCRTRALAVANFPGDAALKTLGKEV